jgi:hypothetical protein
MTTGPMRLTIVWPGPNVDEWWPQKIRPAIPRAVAKAFRDFDPEARRRWPKTEYHFPREDR